MAITELKTKQSNLFTLDRCTAVPSIIGDSSEFLIIAGLSGTAKDIGHLTNESPNAFLLGGAMGAAVTMALGLALSQTDRKVLAVFGDGECLMNSSSLSTVGFGQPNNLSLLCVDNGTYGETGNQLTHTANNADLEIIANGAGIEKTMTVRPKPTTKQRRICYVTRRLQHLYCLAFIKATLQTTVVILTLLKEKLYFVVTYFRNFLSFV